LYVDGAGVYALFVVYALFIELKGLLFNAGGAYGSEGIVVPEFEGTTEYFSPLPLYPLLFVFRRRKHNSMANPTKAITATPPTAAPTMAPMGGPLLVAELAELPVEGLEEDPGEEPVGLLVEAKPDEVAVGDDERVMPTEAQVAFAYATAAVS
jgi:hypothetical protein